MQTTPSKSAKSAKSAPVLIVSENRDYGFFGTVRDDCFGLSKREAADLFNHAGQELVARGLFSTPTEARDFLDSACGRHLADALTFHVQGEARESLAALTQAVTFELIGSGRGYVKSYNRRG